MGNDGVAMFCDRPEAQARPAFDATVAELGYARSEPITDVEVRLRVSPAGFCVRIDATKAFGVVLARRIARRLGRPVRVFTASLVAEDPIDCAVDELLVAPAGPPRQGTWGTDLAHEYGDDWSSLCDGKAYFAVSAILDLAVEAALGVDHAHGGEYHLAAPPSLGAPRLDEIAKQVRLADDAHETSMAGRTCVRIRNAGSTITSFVTAEEASLLRAALGALLPTK